MFIFTCEDRFEDMMCCIYAAWEQALRSGHDSVKLLREPIMTYTLFDDFVHVDFDAEKFAKVVRSVKNKISYEAYVYIWFASLSHEEDALDAIYRYMIKGFKYGKNITRNIVDEEVLRILELKKSVGNEACHFREFARFNSLGGKVYISHIEPKDNVVWLVGDYFADRMPSEYWMVVDDSRKLAVIHPKDSENYMRELSGDEFEKLRETERFEDDYTKMWRNYFDTMSIKQRENYICQRNNFPKWKRKHVTEFN